MFSRQESVHYQNVRLFMEYGKQVPSRGHTAPRLLAYNEQVLRAKLIFEETMETINGLGVSIQVREPYDDGDFIPINDPVNKTVVDHEFQVVHCLDLVKVVDGCADISVVTIGTLVACGVTDVGVLTEVDMNNLAKFGPGHSIRDDGKVIKPPGHKPPDLVQVLIDQGADPAIFSELKQE